MTQTRGFTLLEVLVVIAIIGILSAAIFVNFDEARKQARDDALKSQLQQIKLALETYRSQNGRYPGSNEADLGSSNDCSGPTCSYSSATHPQQYIPNLAFDGHIDALPNDDDFAPGCEFSYYVESGTGTSYKLTADNCVAADEVVANEEFSRCPSVCGTSGDCNPADTTPNYSKTYAIYKGGAEQCK